MTKALSQTLSASITYEAGLARRLTSSSADSPVSLRPLNRVLYGSERTLTLEEGLPGRPWYKHQAYAPGTYTGYSAKTLPGIREAVEAGRWEEANRRVERVARALEEFRRQFERATGELRR